MGTDQLKHELAKSGAWLFVMGLVTGLWAGLVLSEVVVVPIPRLALGAHLTALLGAFWLVAVSATLDRMRYGLTGRWRLTWAVMLATWSNWLITVVASVMGVRGLTFSSDARNNVVAVLLQLFVVLPSVAAAIAWAIGFGGSARHESSQL